MIKNQYAGLGKMPQTVSMNNGRKDFADEKAQALKTVIKQKKSLFAEASKTGGW